jgi:hypothetical protein
VITLGTALDPPRQGVQADVCNRGPTLVGHRQRAVGNARCASAGRAYDPLPMCPAPSCGRDTSEMAPSAALCARHLCFAAPRARDRRIFVCRSRA